ncbi:hypothetical protein [Odoribacter laneus]|jgi:hypothetical protein|uniref:hypothetical protein n=1 Tax=Odoribacter laneus TaxID=626933 RepID=UPI003FEF2E0A
MIEANKPRCGNKKGNSGIPSCDFNPGRITGSILIRKGQELSGEELEDVIDTLKKRAQGDVKKRVYPVFHFGTITDNSTEPTSENLGVGYDRFLNEGTYNFTFILANGKLCYAKQLRNFNGDAYDAFLVLDNGLFGVKTRDGNVRGFTMSQFYLSKFTVATDTTSARFNVNMVFPKPEEFNDDPFYIDTEQDISYEVKGILDYEIVQKTASAEKVTVDIVGKCDKASILEMYGNELADENLWNGATAVVLENGLLSFTGEYSNGAVISCVDVEKLAEKGIGGFPEYGVEISPLTVKITE